MRVQLNSSLAGCAGIDVAPCLRHRSEPIVRAGWGGPQRRVARACSSRTLRWWRSGLGPTPAPVRRSGAFGASTTTGSGTCGASTGWSESTVPRSNHPERSTAGRSLIANEASSPNRYSAMSASPAAIGAAVWSSPWRTSAAPGAVALSTSAGFSVNRSQRSSGS